MPDPRAGAYLMWRAVASNVLTLMVVALALVAALVAWGKQAYRAPGPLSAAICLEVPSGASMRGVSADLEARDAVRSGAVFRLGAAYTDRAQDLKAGSFLVPEGASMDEITAIITEGGRSTCGTEIVYRIGVTSADVRVRELDPEAGRFVETARFEPGAENVPAEFEAARAADDTRYRVSIAEGATSWQIVEAIEAIGILEGASGEVPAEGMLAPDSYEVDVGMDRAELLERLLTRQEERLAEAWSAREDGLPIASPEEALILASIVEKETGVAEERPQVASVFVNRLREGMRLQTDPTVIYGLTEGKESLGRGLRQSELDRETPYNTYRIDGLPPTPIANPGRDALQAAVRPAETDYLYFVADGTGGHAFATTLEEHNSNVARWREIEAEQVQENAPGE